MMQMKTKHRRLFRRTVTITTTILLALLMAGCYWTPPEDEGSINISLSGNDVATNRITASATDDGVDALLEVYVISESVLRGDQSAVDEAFADLDQQFMEAQEDFAADPTSFDPESYDLSINLPQFQFQAGFLALGADGIEGQSRFGGLRAGEGYLVFVNLWGLETYVDAIAFDSVDIEAGETTTVDLQLDDSADAWMAYVEFLTENYGYGDTTPTTDTGDIEISQDTFGVDQPSENDPSRRAIFLTTQEWIDGAFELQEGQTIAADVLYFDIQTESGAFDTAGDENGTVYRFPPEQGVESSYEPGSIVRAFVAKGGVWEAPEATLNSADVLYEAGNIGFDPQTTADTTAQILSAELTVTTNADESSTIEWFISLETGEFLQGTMTGNAQEIFIDE